MNNSTGSPTQGLADSSDFFERIWNQNLSRLKSFSEARFLEQIENLFAPETHRDSQTKPAADN